MADIKLKIQSNLDVASSSVDEVQLWNVTQIGEGHGTISNTSIQEQGSSRGWFQSVPSGENNTANGLSWALGELCFNGNDNLDNIVNSDAVLESEKNGDVYIFGATDDNGYEPVDLRIYGEGLQAIVLRGDEKTGQYPVEATINEELVTNTNNSLEAKCDPSLSYQRIYITKWSKPNYNAVITSIEVFQSDIWVDIHSGLKSVETLTQTTGQPKEIYYGGVESRGSAEIFDKNSNIKDLIDIGVIDNSQVKVEIWANGKKLTTQKTNDSNYENKNFSIEFGDVISQLQQDQISSKTDNTVSALYLLKEMLNFAGLKEEQYDLSNKVFLGEDLVTIEEYLDTITLKNIHSQASAKKHIDDICVATQLNYYEKDGVLVFVSARPRIVDKEQSILHIPSKYQHSTPSKDVLLKNKYSKVDMKRNKITTTLQKQMDENGNEVDYSAVGNLRPEVDFTKEYFVVNKDENGVYINDQKSLYYDPQEGGSYGSKGYYKNSGNTQQYPLLIDGDYWQESARADVYIQSGSFKISKSDYPFDKIEIAKENGSPKIEYSVTEYEGLLQDSSLGAEVSPEDAIKWYYWNIYEGTKDPFRVYAVAKKISDNSSLSNGASVTFTHHDGTTSDTLWAYPNACPSPIITIEPTGDGWNINYKLYAGKIEAKMSMYGKIENGNFSTWGINSFTGNGYQVKIFQIPKITVTLNAYIINAQFEENLHSIENSKIEKKVTISLQESEYLQTISKIQTQKGEDYLSTYIGSNILEDYSNGISTAKLTSVCGDLYDSNGTKIKDWNKGETYEVGDIVQVDKDNKGNSLWTYANKEPMLWRVTGRNFHKEGVPLVDLELQEVK